MSTLSQRKDDEISDHKDKSPVGRLKEHDDIYG